MLFASALLVSVVPSTHSFAQPNAGREKISFDIAAQPLPEALSIYARVAGVEIVVDDRVLSGHRSVAIVGTFDPIIALRHMVAGTGLDIRYLDRGAVTLQPHRPPAPEMSDPYDRFGTFSSALQAALVRSICGHNGPVIDRIAAQLWIAPDSTVERVLLLDSTGDVDRDAVISKQLASLIVEQARPADLPQPATIVMTPLLAPRDGGCGIGKGAGRAP